MNQSDRRIQSIIVSRMLMGKVLSRSDSRMPEYIHIDELSRRYRDPQSWFAGGLHCFALARQAQDQLGRNALLVLRFSLRDGHRARGPFIRSVGQLTGLFDVAPPEVMCLWRHRTRFVPTPRTATLLQLNTAEFAEFHAFLTEWQPTQGGKIARAVWLREERKQVQLR